MRLYRQGDLAIREVPRVPAGAQLQPDLVLAYGETTGHRHRVEGRGRVWRQDTRLYLELEEPSALVHEEHNPVRLPPGIYEVLGQREYVSPAEERRVFD